MLRLRKERRYDEHGRPGWDFILEGPMNLSARLGRASQIGRSAWEFTAAQWAFEWPAPWDPGEIIIRDSLSAVENQLASRLYVALVGQLKEQR